MIDTGVAFGRFETPPFLGDDMEKSRSSRSLHLTHVAQRFDQHRKIMAINRPDIVEAKLFKEGAGHHQPFEVFFPTAGKVFDRGQRSQHLLAALTNRGIGPAGKNSGEVV